MNLYLNLLLLTNALVIRSISASSAFPGNYVFNKPQVRVTTTFADFDARIMDQWGNGGGPFVQISNTSHHPFQYRTLGGAKRAEICGTRAFGSGYPYGAKDPSSVAGRPFPFGTWPLWWDQNFMGSGEYGPHLDAIRPGGMLVTVPLQTTTEHFNITDEEAYHIVGDKESVLLLMISYVTWCHITPAWPSRFDPTRSNSTVRLENVVRYYRASSFAISSPNYNNTFARSSLSNSTESTPLPPSIEYSPFLKCIDDVTLNALAILNKPPGMTHLDRLIEGLKYGGVFIIGGGIYILVMIGFILYGIRACLCQLLQDKSARRERERKAAEVRREALARERVEELRYEMHP